jgi:pimeloyl-ACP methyl ester carboxylesterase
MRRARDRFARLRGLRFHWLEWGTAGAPPVLMLHGGAQTAHSFDEVAPRLARDHDVVCLDQRGHGDTDWAPRYRHADYVADIDALLDHLGWDTVALVGMSLGGVNAMAHAADHPERVSALVVVDVVPTVAPEGRDAIAKQLSVQEFASFDDAVTMAHAFNPRRTLDNIRERLGHAMRACPDGRWRYKFDPGMTAAATDIEALWAHVRRIRCPTLLVRGAESPIVTPEAAARFLRTVHGSRLAEVAGAGHSVMGDNPAGFLAAVGPFLRASSLAGRRGAARPPRLSTR